MFESFLLHIKKSEHATGLKKKEWCLHLFQKNESFDIVLCFSEALAGLP